MKTVRISTEDVQAIVEDLRNRELSTHMQEVLNRVCEKIVSKQRSYKSTKRVFDGHTVKTANIERVINTDINKGDLIIIGVKVWNVVANENGIIKSQIYRTTKTGKTRVYEKQVDSSNIIRVKDFVEA